MVNRVVVPLHIHGEGKGPDALAFIQVFVLVGDLTRFDHFDQSEVEHLRVDTEVLESRVSHGGDTGGGQ